jgi:hypothetical protein
MAEHERAVDAELSFLRRHLAADDTTAVSPTGEPVAPR